MAVNIGPKIGIDGEREYRKQINGLITQSKTFSAEMKELEADFNDGASAMEKNRKKAALLEKQIKNQEKTVDELEKGLEASRKKYGENATQTQKWKQAVSNAKTELSKMQSELKKIPSSLQQVGQNMQSVGKKMQSVGGNMSKYVTAPLTAIGAASIAAWKEVDEGLDIVVKKTGATGEALASLQKSATTLATTLPTSFETAGAAIGEVNTRFGLVGEDLETLSGKFVKFAELNDTDVSSSVDKVQKVMEAFGLETEDAGALLDVLNKTGQDTGISMDTLESSMLKNAASLKAMGLDAYSAAQFLGEVETSGIGTETVMTGLSKALTNAAEDGKTLPDALAEFQGIMNSTATDQEKLNAAVDLFGKKAGPAIYEACKTGSLSFASLSADAASYLGSVETTFDNVIDPADNFTIALNQVKAAGSEIGGTLLSIAAPAVAKLGDYAQSAGEWFAGLTKEEQNNVAYAGMFAAGIGPALTVMGKITEAAGTAVSKVAELGTTGATIGGVAGTAALALGGLALMGTVLEAGRKATLDSNETLQEILPNLTTTATELSTATDSLATVVKDAQDNIDNINAKSNAADDLINELFLLEKQSGKTAVQQQRMKLIVDQLNSMYPDLGLSIDKATGKLNKGETAVRGYVKSAQNLALIDAYGKAAADTIDELAKHSIAYQKALQAQEAGQEKILQLQEEYNAAVAAAPLDTTNSGYYDELTQSWRVLTPEIVEAGEALTVAQEAQGALNAAVDEASEVVSQAQADYDAYTAAQASLEEDIEVVTETQEEQTEAVKENTGALRENVAAGMDLAKKTAKVIAETSKEIQAWDDLYQAAYDSITGQMGLFDEWEQDTEITAADILKNLETQKEGFENYNTNLAKLTKMAVESNDPNFKAFVQSLAEMGIDAAGELQALVDAAENGSGDFNDILTLYGDVDAEKMAYSKNLAYIQSDFQSKGDIISKGFNKALSTIGESKTFKSINSKIKNLGNEAKKQSSSVTSATQKDGKAISSNLTGGFQTGFKSLPIAAAAATGTAVKSTQASINGMSLAPTVSKINVPEDKKASARQEVVGALANVPGSVGKLANAVKAGQTAKTEASGQLNNIKGKMTGIDGVDSAVSAANKKASSGIKVPAKIEISNISQAARDAKDAFLRSIGKIYVPVAATTSNQIRPMATGGFITEPTLVLAGEGGNDEAVIPLEANRTRALSLYQEVGQILGVSNSASVGRTASVAMPNNQPSIDMDKLYSAVAAGAERGMQNAQIKFLWNNREIGRNLRDMGVAFT